MTTETRTTTHMPIDVMDITEEQCLMIVPPNFIGMMTGVRFARFMVGDRVELTYTNGSTESAALPRSDYVRVLNSDSFFDVVSAVQEQNRTA